MGHGTDADPDGELARDLDREPVGDLDRELAGELDREPAGELVIEPVTTREAADQWHQIARECSEADYYEMPADPVQEVYERIESTRSDEHYELWLGYLKAASGVEHTGGAG